jgi:hypothetical protein
VPASTTPELDPAPLELDPVPPLLELDPGRAPELEPELELEEAPELELDVLPPPELDPTPELDVDPPPLEELDVAAPASLPEPPLLAPPLLLLECPLAPPSSPNAPLLAAGEQDAPSAMAAMVATSDALAGMQGRGIRGTPWPRGVGWLFPAGNRAAQKSVCPYKGLPNGLSDCPVASIFARGWVWHRRFLHGRPRPHGRFQVHEKG